MVFEVYLETNNKINHGVAQQGTAGSKTCEEH